MQFFKIKTRQMRNLCSAMLVSGCSLLAASNVLAFQDNTLLPVFSDSTASPMGNFNFTGTTELDLSGSTWGFGLDENDVYHATIRHTQAGAPTNSQWEPEQGHPNFFLPILTRRHTIIADLSPFLFDQEVM